MRMVGPENEFVCEFDRSCRGFLTGEAILDVDVGGEKLGIFEDDSEFCDDARCFDV